MRRPRFILSLLICVAVLVPLFALPTTASARVRPLGRGKVVVTLDPFFAQFIAAGYPFFPFAPASMGFIGTAPHLVLPVTGGTWNKATLRGTFDLKGGLVWVHYTSPTAFIAFSLLAWHAGINTTAGWTGLVNGGRIAIFDENLMGSHPSYPLIRGHRYVRINTVILSYNTAFTNAYAAAFAATLPPGGPFGVATLGAGL